MEKKCAKKLLKELIIYPHQIILFKQITTESLH